MIFKGQFPSRRHYWGTALAFCLTLTAAVMLMQVFLKDSQVPFKSCHATLHFVSSSPVSSNEAKFKLFLLMLAAGKGVIEITGDISQQGNLYHSAKRIEFSYQLVHGFIDVQIVRRQLSPKDTTTESSSPLPDYFGLGENAQSLKLEEIDDRHILLMRNGDPLFIMECEA